MRPKREKALNDNLVMYFTGFTRFSSEVQKVNERSADDKVKQHLQMLALVDEAERILTDDTTDLDEFGYLLDHTWQFKKKTGSAVSTGDIDALLYMTEASKPVLWEGNCWEQAEADFLFSMSSRNIKHSLRKP